MTGQGRVYIVDDDNAVRNALRLLFRTAAIEAEAFSSADAFLEDADLTRRAWDLGMKPVICPDAKFMHEVGKSSATRLAKSMLLYKGKACYVRTHWKGLHQSLGLAMLSFGVWLRAMGERIRGFDTESADQSPWSGLWRRRREWRAGYPHQRPAGP